MRYLGKKNSVLWWITTVRILLLNNCSLWLFGSMRTLHLELQCDSRNSDSARRVCIAYSGQSAVPETKSSLLQRFVV